MMRRSDLHTILDSLPEERLAAAQEALAALADPVVLALLGVPDDDESLTDEDLEAITEGRADQDGGRTVSLEEYAIRQQLHS
jgi:hypothetical protein